jgi:hypothetical protein
MKLTNNFIIALSFILLILLALRVAGIVSISYIPQDIQIVTNIRDGWITFDGVKIYPSSKSEETCLPKIKQGIHTIIMGKNNNILIKKIISIWDVGIFVKEETTLQNNASLEISLSNCSQTY